MQIAGLRIDPIDPGWHVDVAELEDGYFQADRIDRRGWHVAELVATIEADGLAHQHLAVELQFGDAPGRTFAAQDRQRIGRIRHQLAAQRCLRIKVFG